MKFLEGDRKLGGSGRLRMKRWISWERPSMGWVKIISDGSLNAMSGMGTVGGLIRDEFGQWRGGFIMNIWVCSIMARAMGTLDDVPGVHSGLVLGIKELLGRPWQVKVTHVFREVKFVVDHLASFVAAGSLRYHVLHVPPDGVLHWLHHDIIGVAYPRAVCNITH
ncbi:Polynucleotidyl transferase- ribonuclease H-like superfamily protein [Striga hermonthica]|uniref:Polynucleotidyl transferase- ribonuclease H-like superfamily protein n=1 Tax=Striga hermonthica TaxID=68872 RepID=A0A9N7QYM6_STRHE|nr:Polynucleotidyl transferase- ribonuclease H-like superfamily protein [Striga hermonthica]